MTPQLRWALLALVTIGARPEGTILLCADWAA